MPSARRRGIRLPRLLTALLASALLLTGFAAAPASADVPETIAAGVTVDGVAVGGLTRVEATTLLGTELAHYASGEVVIHVDELEARIPYGTLGRQADVATLVEVAWSIGRTPPESLPNGLGRLIHGTTVDPLLAVDAAMVATAVAAAAARIEVAPVNGTARATATSFARTAARAGRGMPQQAVIDQLTPLLADPAAASPITIAVASSPLPPVVDDADVTAAIGAAKRMVRSVVVLDGSVRLPIAARVVRSWIRFDLDGTGGYRPVINATAATRAIGPLASRVKIAPRNARILSPSRGTRLTNVSIRPARNGRRLNVAATTGRVATAVEARASAPASSAVTTVRAAVTIVKASVDAAAAQKLVSRLRRQGPGWTTFYVTGEANGFGANITIPARTLNGFVVGPGETFDFWEALGEVSYAKGYRNGGAIIGGHTNPTGALAGGICSASTTLFNAAARAGLDIVERHNHYYYITRYPKGLDATVSKTASGGGQNMRFRNDTNDPILIRGFAGRGWVTFQVWGVPNGRRVSFSRPAVSNYEGAYDTVQYTNSLPHGVRKRVEYPVDGFYSAVERTVRDARGRILHQDHFTSAYHRIIGVVFVGR